MSIPTAGYTIAGASSATTAPLPVQVTQADHAADYIAMYSSAAAGTVAINLANLLGTVSQTMGIIDVQSVSNKTNDNSNTYATKDTSLTLQNAASSTKRAQFLLSSITAGQTRIFTLPDYNGTIATQGGTETLINKTLTAPIITNATISSDIYSGFSNANSGTIYGMSVTAGILASTAITGQVNTAALQTNAVGAANIAINAIYLGSSQITSNAVITNTSQSDIGLGVTVNIPNGGRHVEITIFGSRLYSTTNNARADVGIWDGPVGTGTLLNSGSGFQDGGTGSPSCFVLAITPSPGAVSKTYNVGLSATAGTATLEAASTRPAIIMVKVI